MQIHNYKSLELDAPSTSGEAPPLAAMPTPRERLLVASAQLFGRYGINAVGVDTIVEAAGTAKTTLYKAFGSKERLVDAVLDEAGRKWRSYFFGEIEQAASPAEKLDRVFPALRKWFETDSYFGCPFANAVGEHDKYDERLRTIARDHKHEVRRRLMTIVTDAGYHQAEQLTDDLILLIDGAIVGAMISRDGRPADTAEQAYRKLFGRPSH